MAFLRLLVFERGVEGVMTADFPALAAFED